MTEQAKDVGLDHFAEVLIRHLQQIHVPLENVGLFAHVNVVKPIPACPRDTCFHPPAQTPRSCSLPATHIQAHISRETPTNNAVEPVCC